MKCGAFHDANQQFFFTLQMMESHHSPLANAFGMAVCSSHYMFLINSGPKKNPGNKQKLSLKKYILTSLTLKEKKKEDLYF